MPYSQIADLTLTLCYYEFVHKVDIKNEKIKIKSFKSYTITSYQFKQYTTEQS